MKLVLDFSRPKLPKLFWILLLTCSLVIVIWQAPASWLGGSLASQTGCRVMLHQALGTVWQGSAALAFSEPNVTEGGCREARSVTERFHWKTTCKPFALNCRTEIVFAALDQPQVIGWDLGKTLLSANQVKLPANVLEGLGNPWSTLRPRGELGARWTDLSLVRGNGAVSGNAGVIRIIINNLSSPISPVKPLGSYEILANIGDEGFTWTLVTTSGPLLLRGQGDTQSGVHFVGEAEAAPEAQDSLIGLLSLLGKKEGDIYRLKF